MTVLFCHLEAGNSESSLFALREYTFVLLWEDKIVSERVTGTVKWFNTQKGYGFISHEGNDDVFVHYSSLQGSGFRNLEEGEQVEFEVEQDPKGPQAVNVKRLGAASDTDETETAFSSFQY